MKIAIIGAGNVGSTLGAALARAGHEIIYALQELESQPDPRHTHERATRALVPDAVSACDLALLSTPWAATEDALKAAGDLDGKILLDVTNPIGPGFVLTHGHTDSGGEQVARWAPTARVVKIFNTTGVENMADPQYGDARAVMFACSDDKEACELAMGLAQEIGFEAVYGGPLQEARYLEPFAMLWIRQALVYKQGRRFAFGLLRR